MTSGWSFKYLTGTTGSDEILRDKTLNIAKNLKYHGYKSGLGLMVYKFFDKIFSHGQRPWLCKINLLLKTKMCQTKN